MSNDKVAALRALLDEAGLVVESIEPEEDGDGFGATLAGGSVLWLDGDTDACAVQAGYLREDFTTEHDTLAAALGLPSAAEVREMRAEVERLRGVLDNAGAWRAESEANEAILRADRDAAVAEVERLRDLLLACARAIAAMGVPDSGPIADAFDAADAALSEVPRG